MTTRTFWVAETPGEAGPMYAMEIGVTSNVHDAKQFVTKEECHEWMVGKSLAAPYWTAVEHALFGGGEKGEAP